MSETVAARVVGVVGTARPRSRVPSAAVVMLLALLLGAIAISLSVTALPALSSGSHAWLAPWWVYVPLFPLTERLALHLRVGRSAHTFSFGHVSLVFALCLLDPGDALVAAIAGSLLTLALRRRSRGIKLLFNVGLWTFEATVAVCLYGVLIGGAHPASARGIVAALLTIVITDQLSALAVSTAISVHEGSLDIAGARESLTWGLLVAVANTSLALLAVVLLRDQPAAAALLAVVLGMLFLSYRAYEQLNGVLTRLQGHHKLAGALVTTRRTTVVVEQVLESSRAILEADIAELHLPDRSYRLDGRGRVEVLPTTSPSTGATAPETDASRAEAVGAEVPRAATAGASEAAGAGTLSAGAAEAAAAQSEALGAQAPGAEAPSAAAAARAEEVTAPVPDATGPSPAAGPARRHGGAGSAREIGPDEAVVPPDYWRVRLATRGTARLVASLRGTAEQKRLAKGDVNDAVATTVEVGGGRTGVLVVADRIGETATFTVDDENVLQTIAGQAGTALSSIRLLDRLQTEVAERAYEARHDSLTGLVNRQQFLAVLAAEIERRGGAGVLVIDLDRFQDVNDALGHEIGDAVLCEVARRVSDAVGGLLVARIGGDVLAVVVPSPAEFGAAAPGGMTYRASAAPIARLSRRVSTVADAVQESLREAVTVDTARVPVGAAIGSAVAPRDAADALGLLQVADVAMHRAKDRRSGYEPFSPRLDRTSAERLALFSDLRQAVLEREIDIAFQPYSDPATGEVRGAEALARWSRAGHGRVAPAVFIALAERSGLIVPLTELILERALREFSWLGDVGLPGISVNLSPRLLLDPALPGLVAAVVAREGVAPSAVTLEVTETAVMSDPAAAMARLSELRALGFQLAVDDYGTGHSSLAYLKDIPADRIKIDKAFVTNLVTDERDAAIVRSTIALAHELGYSVVAEGVEDDATLELLAQWQCDLVQGYLVGRPFEPEDLAPWLRDRPGAELGEQVAGAMEMAVLPVARTAGGVAMPGPRSGGPGAGSGVPGAGSGGDESSVPAPR